MGAREMFDAAKHPRGFHGRFGTGGVVTRTSVGRRDEGEGLRELPQRLSASAERARKLKIKQKTEVARGVRPPANWGEEQSLVYASPRKLAESRARGEGGFRPRRGPDSALHVERWAAGGFRTNRIGIEGTYLTFAGKRIRDRSPAGKRGAKLTSRGRYNLAKYRQG
jgi:hypothetical protein